MRMRPLTKTAPARRRLRPFVAAVTAAALAMTGAVAVAAPAAAAAGSVSGMVFRDFNGNGVRDTGTPLTGVATDKGLAGVTVTAVDGGGATVGVATSLATGQYTIDTSSVDDGTPLRLEFSGWPSAYEPSGTAGSSATNGTSVQFVAAGAENVEFALNKPADYAQDAPPIVVAIQRAGDPSVSEEGRVDPFGTPVNSVNGAAIAGIPYTTNTPATVAVPRTQATDFPDRVVLATFLEVGAVEGLQYQASSDSVFALASLKRQSGLGELGLGGIYRVTDVLDDTTGELSDAGSVESWLDVTDPAGLNINLGSISSNADRGLDTAIDPAHDTEAFQKAGKVGFGGSALSEDGNTLYFVNLFDKKLYAIDISDPATPPTTYESWDLGLGSGQRPWAVEVHDGEIFIGYADTGETLSDSGDAVANPGRSAADAQLSAYVMKSPVDSIGTWTQVATVDLGYVKGALFTLFSPPVQASQWNTWTDEWSWGAGEDVAFRVYHFYPQAILSSLSFDDDDFMTMAFMDRSGLQSGNINFPSDPDFVDPANPRGLYQTITGGDLLIAAPTASGTYAVESNGVVGSGDQERTTATTILNEGPGGNEFYNDANDLGKDASLRGYHREVGLGATAQMAGTSELISTVFDPLTKVRVSGLSWFNEQNGAPAAGYEMTAASTRDPAPASTDGSFQKGGGLGAVALLAENSPVEIGNRVWFDADQDGVQDADEPSVSGMEVVLRDSEGDEVARTTTDASGEYYFRSDEDDFATSGEYTVVFVKPDSGAVTLTGPNATAFGALDWEDISFTTPGAGSGTTDSNPDDEGVASVTLNGPGMNDHTIDAGLVANTAFTVQKLIDDAGGEATTGQTFAITAAARDFRGDALTLSQSSFTLAANETSSAVSVPVGASVLVTEAASTDVKGVAIELDGAAHTDYAPLTGSGGTFAFRVSNTLYAPGTIEISKAVTGSFDLESPELLDSVFTVSYTYAGGSGSIVLNEDNSWTAESAAIPYGAVVTLAETTITGAAASVGFDTPTWSAGDQGDGTAQVTVGDGTKTELVLTNPTTLLQGGFAVTKSVTGDAASRVPADTYYGVEYSTDNGVSWSALGNVLNSQTLPGPTDLALGSEVLLREGARAEIPGVEWGTPMFSGTGVTDNGDGTGSVRIASGTVAVTLSNPTTALNGQFSVMKDVTGDARSLLRDNPEFVVSYSSAAGDGELRVRDGQTASSPALPAGTVVTVTEVAPAASTLPAGATWESPVLVLDGTRFDNGAQFTIGDGTVLAITVANDTRVEPQVEITKGDGDAQALTIAHEADTVAEGEVYAPGEKRDVVIQVTNPGPEPLREVTLTDSTTSGGVIENLVWQMPDGSEVSAVLDEASGVWSAQWAATFDPGTTVWAVDDVIYGTATLTMDETASAADAHQNNARVDAVGALSATPVSDENPYNAFTGAIQVIKYDGEKSDPVIGNAAEGWQLPVKPLLDADQDANTTETAVEYPVDTARDVRWVVTNTGDTSLTNLTLTDTTLDGPEIGDDWKADLSAFGGPADYSFNDSGAWPGILPPGASFFAFGTLTLPAEKTHADRVDVVGTVVVPATDGEGVPTDQPAVDGEGNPVIARTDSGEPFTVDDDDPFNAFTGEGPEVTVLKGDGSGTSIVNEADSMVEGEGYEPGESRTIVFQVTNSGEEPLVDVVLRDSTIAGGQVANLEWTLPNGDTLQATRDDDATWSANWAGPWAVGAVITGTATLTIGAADAPHVDRVTVNATGQASGIPVSDENDYNAFTGEIQVIKYDGEKADPIVKTEGGEWIKPTKPLEDAFQDANDTDTAVEYAVGVDNKVRWVVTNMGDTWLTDLTLSDTTLNGPEIGSDWTADLSPFGGPSDYSFENDGPWAGLFPPGASFFAQGTLVLEAEDRHADNVDVIGTVVVPAVGDDGVTPNGQPQMQEEEPVRATIDDPENPGTKIPFLVDDEDPFHAWTGVGPYVNIEKGDGSDQSIANDADTMADGQLYENGQTREIVFVVENTGDEDLINVTLTDQNVSGGQVENLSWTLPDGSTLAATREGDVWSARWAATFEDAAVWEPGEKIFGTATLTLDGTGEPHVDNATVDAEGAASGIPVSDDDPYNAFTAGIQVIKYDGNKADPIVKTEAGKWIIPMKPLSDATQDANDVANSVKYTAGESNKVRWVVTNTGSTWLTSIDLSDVTDNGPAIGDNWTADLSEFGGPAAYNFVTSGTWFGLIAPGASFFAEGTLTLGENVTHADTVTVVGTPVVPEVDPEGNPTGNPSLDPEGNPVPVMGPEGAPVKITDNDPFNAHTPAPPLAITGAVLPTGIVLTALLMLTLGLLLAVRKRASAHIQS